MLPIPIIVEGKNQSAMCCHRCGGRMIFEKYYDVNSIFYGWHCVMCGEIIDPVILLHRLSQDANLEIPEGKEKVFYLLKQYLDSKPGKVQAEKG
jgi:hypothetical protein